MQNRIGLNVACNVCHGAMQTVEVKRKSETQNAKVKNYKVKFKRGRMKG